MNDFSTIGIVFDADTESGFPTLETVGYSYVQAWTDRSAIGSLAAWLVVARDPRRLRYFDDSSEAMDETNIDAILVDFIELDAPTDADEYNPTEDDEDADEEGRRPIYSYGNVLLVRPDDERAIEIMRSYSRALSDYPLLDESSYCEREHDAWLEYVNNGLKYDTLSDLSKLVDDDTLEAIDNGWNDIAPEASQHLHYYNGWDGSHSPDFSECIATVIGITLSRTLTSH